jgi:formamidopyrimidine-DNA glycosylase
MEIHGEKGSGESNMPELPEMENYRTLLGPLIGGQTIKDVQVNRLKSINVDLELFSKVTIGSSVVNLERRAKHLLFHLSSGKLLLLHLMLGGWMFFGRESEKPDRTIQVEISFGDRKLYFIGLRLGYLHLHDNDSGQQFLSKLGPEPLEAQFDLSDFQSLLKGRRTSLKATLVDQSFLSGIGNCYSDEICFIAGLLPARRIHTLSAEEQARLFHSIQNVLKEAIHYGGYMESPLYVGDTLTGNFNHRCRVYDCEGNPCTRCGSPIVFHEVASRKCFYCMQCQH